MLYWLSYAFEQHFSPFRIFRSHAFLLAFGTILAAGAVWYLLPRLWHLMPHDQGKAILGPDGMKSAGKPTGAGALVTLVALPAILLAMPFSVADLCVILCLYAAMVCGFLDDASHVPWGQLKKGLLDAACCFGAAFFLYVGHGSDVWFPFVTGFWSVPTWIYIPCATFLLWVTMNATNCSDGVDGLAGSLSLVTLVTLSAFLYLVIGYVPVAHYLLVPANPNAARWAILLMTVAGAVSGYLWWNAEPSKVLMGDAGSRFLGLLVGCGVLVTGNPFLLLAMAPIVLVNGGGGLVKLVLLRLFKRAGLDAPAVLNRYRFPLHDHCKKNLHWSNAEVLMRFMLLQAFVMPLLIVILVKVR